MRIHAFVFASIIAFLPGFSIAAATFHVSPTGDDRNDGSAAKPFATFERARDAVRVAKHRPGPIDVVIAAGDYPRERTFELGEPDSGAAAAQITWRAQGVVRVVGGQVLDAKAFARVTDAKVLERLRPEARDAVRRLDLAPFAKDALPIYPDDFRGVPAVPELFFNDQRMTVSRWPNKGWATVAKLVETGSIPRDGDQSGKPGSFEYAGDEPSRWDVSAGVWLQGYWCYDWYDQTLRVGSIDRDRKLITLAAPALYGVRQGNPSPRRYRALNLLEELDEPGEYYVNPAEKSLYFWPPTSRAGARIVLSTLNGPLLKVTDAKHLVIRGMTFESTLGDGIEIRGGADVEIERCIVRNTRELGIRIVGGALHRVTGCDITDTGTGGLLLEGGNRATLTPAGHEAVDNHIWNFSRHQLTGAYGLSFGGVGNRAAHNLIHDAPHQAVYVGGNDHVFEYNIVRNVVTETDDAGALYKGRNPSCRGNIIRYNFWSDIGSSLGHGTGAIYFDDGDGGDVVFGNIFLRCGFPGAGPFGTVFSHGGHDIAAESNIFIDCQRPFGSAPWGDDIWKEAVNGGFGCEWTPKLLKEVDITKPPFTTRYPELLDFFKPEPAAERVSYAKNNVVVRAASLATGNWSYVPNQILSTNEDPGFVDAAHGNYELRADSEVFTRLPGFKPIPFSKIGPRRGKTAEGKE